MVRAIEAEAARVGQVSYPLLDLRKIGGASRVPHLLSPEGGTEVAEDLGVEAPVRAAPALHEGGVAARVAHAPG